MSFYLLEDSRPKKGRRSNAKWVKIQLKLNPWIEVEIILQLYTLTEGPMSRKNKVQIIHVVVFFFVSFYTYKKQLHMKARLRNYQMRFSSSSKSCKKILMNLGFPNLLSVEVQKVNFQVHNFNVPIFSRFVKKNF